MSSDDARISTDELLELAKPVHVDTLESWPESIFDGDVGQRAIQSAVFGQTGLVYTYGNMILWGDDLVQAQRHQPDDDGMVPTVDFAAAGYSLEKAKAAVLAMWTNARRDVIDHYALAELVTDLNTWDPDIAAATGWDGDALDDYLAALDSIHGDETGGGPDGDPDDLPDPVGTEPITQPGDVWILDRHRVYCADAATIELPGDAALITDPPYGVAEPTNRYAKGRSTSISDAADFPPITGDDKPFDPTPWLEYSPAVLFGANHYADRLPLSPTWIVWDKLAGLETEKRTWGFNDNADVELAWSNIGGPARMFSHRWMGINKHSEHGDRRVHPTQKPVALFHWLISNTTDKDATVLDPYAGSGSCLMACHHTGRTSISVEIEPGYVDTICARFQRATGIKPVLESTGEPHSFVEDG